MKLDICSATIIHAFTCKDCNAVLKKHFAKESSSKAGSTRTEAKAEASRANGAKGGRPRKHNEATRKKMRDAWARRKANQSNATKQGDN